MTTPTHIVPSDQQQVLEAAAMIARAEAKDGNHQGLSDRANERLLEFSGVQAPEPITEAPQAPIVPPPEA